MTLLDCYRDAFLLGLAFARAPNEWEYEQLYEKALNSFTQAKTLAATGQFTEQQQSLALFAVTAWFDEQILCSQWGSVTLWSNSLVQYHYFQTALAGDLFFDKLQEIDAIDIELKRLYLLCLLLGFKGKYNQTDSAELDKILSTQALALPDSWRSWPNQEFITPLGAQAPTRTLSWMNLLLDHPFRAAACLSLTFYGILFVLLFF